MSKTARRRLAASDNPAMARTLRPAGRTAPAAGPVLLRAIVFGRDCKKRGRSLGRAEFGLAADAETFDERPVARLVALLDIVEKLATQRNQLEQAATRMVVLHMRLEMLGEIGDALGQD